MADPKPTDAAAPVDAPAAATEAEPTPSQPPHHELGGKHPSVVTGGSATATTAAAAAAPPRPRYKSWRKKYRKMRHTFDARLEENKSGFKAELKLETIARRLREELDGLLELCLELNQNPHVPPELRFDVSLELSGGGSGSSGSSSSSSNNKRLISTVTQRAPAVVPAGITPVAADELLRKYAEAVKKGDIPPLDLHVIRDQVNEGLAAQGVEELAALEARVPHAAAPAATRAELMRDGDDDDDEELLLPEHLRPSNADGVGNPSFLTTETENEYLTRLDARLPDNYSINGPGAGADDRPDQQQQQQQTLWHQPSIYSIDPVSRPDLNPRELERQNELHNPQSQHNWLKQHMKLVGAGAMAGVNAELLGADDTESLASQSNEPSAPAAATATPTSAGAAGTGAGAGSGKGTHTPRKRGGHHHHGGGHGHGGKNLAKQVGDRAVERATREGWSPGGTPGDAEGGMDEDDAAFLMAAEGTGGSGKKRGRGGDPDGTYRAKGGKGGGGSKGGKRKRGTEEGGAAGSKKAKVEGNGTGTGTGMGEPGA